MGGGGGEGWVNLVVTVKVVLLADDVDEDDSVVVLEDAELAELLELVALVVLVAGGPATLVLLVVVLPTLLGEEVDAIEVANWDVVEEGVVSVNDPVLVVDAFGAPPNSTAEKVATPRITKITIVAPKVVLFMDQRLHRSMPQYPYPSSSQYYVRGGLSGTISLNIAPFLAFWT